MLMSTHITRTGFLPRLLACARGAFSQTTSLSAQSSSSRRDARTRAGSSSTPHAASNTGLESPRPWNASKIAASLPSAAGLGRFEREGSADRGNP